VFLKRLIKNNRPLIDCALKMHQGHIIPSNCFVIDLDMVSSNASLMGARARETGLKMYLMTKHFNRNPLVAAAALPHGFEGVVAVDIYGAAVNWSYGIPVSNIGHLCQVPLASIPEVLNHRPQVVTVYSYEEAYHISGAAEEMGLIQDILLRVISPEDTFFYGQEGGIQLGSLKQEAVKISALKGVNIMGVTSFPCLTYAVTPTQEVEETRNLSTILEAKGVLERDLGTGISQVNAPGNNHIEVFEMLSKRGVTHVEPGQALLGTTPQHAFRDLAGEPCYLYITAVSHKYGGKAYAFGGGLWQGVKMKGNLEKAMVGSVPGTVWDNILDIEDRGQGQVIDYHVILKQGDSCTIGDSVISCSYVQMQQTGSCIAVVQGIQAGAPELLAIFDKGARPVDRHYMPLSQEGIRHMVDRILNK